MIRTYTEAEAYLSEVPKFTKKNPLEETKGFYDFLLNDAKEGQAIQLANLGKIIHVAGTNGKGSVCSFLNSICRESGYKVAMFTSPHLITTRERFQIDGEMISEEEFMESFQWLEMAVEAYHEVKPDYQPTYFERLFFMSLYVFAKAKVDITIMETGLGGRLDTTNVLDKPAISVITEIGFDHMAYLGDTLEKIASEKAGIMKAEIPVVFTDRKSETSVVIEEFAAKLGVPCYKVLKNEYKINEIRKKSIDFSVCSRYYDYIRLTTHTQAVYQVENAAVAIRAIEVLKETQGLDGVTKDTIVRGVEKMRWPGRMEEVVSGVCIDGAHNEDGMQAFIDSIVAKHASLPKSGKCYVVFSAVQDKKYDKMIQMLSKVEYITDFVITRIPGERGANLEDLKQLFQEYTNVPIHVYEEIRDAITYCVQNKGEDGNVYIVGSLYLAGLVEDLFREDSVN
ncbi:MAG: bifunctional folylpolyglutamate synthase/dihydrofolate synthase [Lachnospiraceae bacterium]|nr:bifunctional folylpolyglutamate synthase/dihydrofolate synthase [Lachnospiraceae bacterium]